MSHKSPRVAALQKTKNVAGIYRLRVAGTKYRASHIFKKPMIYVDLFSRVPFCTLLERMYIRVRTCVYRLYTPERMYVRVRTSVYRLYTPERMYVRVRTSVYRLYTPERMYVRVRTSVYRLYAPERMYVRVRTYTTRVCLRTGHKL